ECAANTNNCAQNCTDTPGGYVCSCNDGYVLNLDGFSCDDIDECASGDHRCEQICENTDGGYTCSCNSYYFLKNDGENCFFYPFESTVMVGRPTDVSITVQAVSATGIEVAVEWGTAPNTYDATTIPQTFNDGLAELVLDGLSPDTGYYYQMKYREPGQAVWESLGEFTFHTQRSWGSPFTFVVQSDSHMTMPSQPGTSSGSDTYGNKFYVDDLYRIALANQAAALPDFQFDLGDTFMLDEIWRWEVPNTCAETEETVRAKYMRQRTFLDDIGHSIPLYLVSGNHENEEYWNIDDYEDVADSLPVQSTNARKRYFMNPIPNDFYSGNLDDTQLEIDDDHLKEDYFAFEWGNALFVALDPFWYTTNKPFTGTMGGELNDEVVGNRWDWTLGQEQYQWLKDTLEYSDATFKFVFAHHNTGGKADYSRGGVMGAPFCEWGGYDPVFGANLLTGDWLFDVERPNFELPVHKLLAENGVTIFFHGHDHIFAREELDGVKYFEVPHPASPRYTDQFRQYNDNPDAIVIDNSGHVQVQVKADSITVDYIRSFLPEDEDTNGCEPGYETFKTCYVNGASYYTEVIDAPPADIKPYATDDNVTVLMNSAANFIDVVANDFDFDGDELMVVGTTQPTHGYVVPIETESPYVMYTPNPDYCDETGAFPDTFHYIVSDGSGRTASATVAITVSCILDDTESDSESPD
ncbi:MAG: metallophosphoesterase, partial [Deltaproteobacteria bacterium]|nr:metallophosphoesterase [Deltaproteobacteria bacterium]